MRCDILRLNMLTYPHSKGDRWRSGGENSLWNIGVHGETDGLVSPFSFYPHHCSYQAPEMLTRTGYGKGVDWWALGAFFFEMVSVRQSFQARSQKDLAASSLRQLTWRPAPTRRWRDCLRRTCMCRSHDHSLNIYLLWCVYLSGTSGLALRRVPCSVLVRILFWNWVTWPDSTCLYLSGGVSALKQHAFFDGKDWNALARK